MIKPVFSIAFVIWLVVGIFPPGKIYLEIKGFVGEGSLTDAIVCVKHIPSSVNKSLILLKKVL